MVRHIIAALGLFLSVATAAIAQPSPVSPSSGNLSGGNVTATGSTTARTTAARGADTINSADYGLAVGASGTTNRTALINAIAQACASPTLTVTVPAGNFTVDVSGGEILDQCAGSGVMVSIVGSASGGTFFGVTDTGNNNFLHISPPGGQPNIGHGVLKDFRIYNNTANNTAGAGIALEHTNTIFMSNIEINHFFTNIDCISCVATMGVNLNISGQNSSTGASLMNFRRASNASTNNNPSENTFTNSDIRAGVAGGYPNALVISDSDGLSMTSVHLGFSSGAVMLVQPQFNASGGGTTSDQIDGLHFTGTDFDTSSAGQCIDFEHLASFTGSVGFGIWFTGGSCYHAALDGVLMNDSSVNMVDFTGFDVTTNGNNGMSIQAGTHITISGGNYYQNNTSAGSNNHIQVGGTATHVIQDGASFSKGSSSIATAILVASAADYVTIGANDFTGGSAADVSYTSSGTHNPPPLSSSTDQTSGVWPEWSIGSTTTGYTINNQAGKALFKFFSGTGTNGNIDILSSNTQGSGGIPSITATGADGTGTPAMFAGGSAGKTYIGQLNTPSIVLQAHVASTETGAPTLPSCGSGPAVGAQSTDRSFEMTTGTGAPTTCQINFVYSYATAPKCVVSAQTSGGVPLGAAVTTKAVGTITITLSSGSSGAIIDGICEQ